MRLLQGLVVEVDLVQELLEASVVAQESRAFLLQLLHLILQLLVFSYCFVEGCAYSLIFVRYVEQPVVLLRLRIEVRLQLHRLLKKLLVLDLQGAVSCQLFFYLLHLVCGLSKLYVLCTGPVQLGLELHQIELQLLDFVFHAHDLVRNNFELVDPRSIIRFEVTSRPDSQISARPHS